MDSINSLEKLSRWGLYLERNSDDNNQESLNETNERYSTDNQVSLNETNERYSRDINELNFSVEEASNNVSEEIVIDDGIYDEGKAFSWENYFQNL